VRSTEFRKDYPAGTLVTQPLGASIGDTEAQQTTPVLVLVGDAQRARVMRPKGGDTLDLLWEAYATTPDVRSLGQAPDMNRNSPDATPSSRSPIESNAQFAREVSSQVRILASAYPGMRLVVIAPSSFANELKANLGSIWPSRLTDVVHRDETRLDDEVLRSVIAARWKEP
jgi:hypothetical protein